MSTEPDPPNRRDDNSQEPMREGTTRSDRGTDQSTGNLYEWVEEVFLARRAELHRQLAAIEIELMHLRRSRREESQSKDQGTRRERTRKMTDLKYCQDPFCDDNQNLILHAPHPTEPSPAPKQRAGADGGNPYSEGSAWNTIWQKGYDHGYKDGKTFALDLTAPIDTEWEHHELRLTYLDQTLLIHCPCGWCDQTDSAHRPDFPLHERVNQFYISHLPNRFANESTTEEPCQHGPNRIRPRCLP